MVAALIEHPAFRAVPDPPPSARVEFGYDFRRVDACPDIPIMANVESCTAISEVVPVTEHPSFAIRHSLCTTGAEMFFWILLIFITLPLIELALLIRVGQWIDLWPTIGLVVTTGAVGATLARREGFRTWRRVQADLAEGRVPGSRIVDALLILVAGVLLITPGLITDTLGFALLVPPIRNAFKRWMGRYFQSRVVTIRRDVQTDDGFVDVEVTEVRDTPSGGKLP